jgi:adenylate cyclase class IV
MPRKDTPEGSREEVEIKLRVTDRAAMLRRLTRLKAKPDCPRVHEMNTLYDTADGALARQGRLLRVRVEHPAPRASRRAGEAGNSRPRAVPRSVLLTFKGPVKGASTGTNRDRDERSYKVRQEREVRVLDEGAIAAILEAIGLSPWFRYEKYRSTYRLPGLGRLKVMLDETPAGDFLELEGGREAIDRSAELLGYGARDYLAQSYGSVWRESTGRGREEPSPGCGLEDMLFAKGR